ncbi:MAG: phosphotransferase family protein [Actinomycetota bacterium]|nr:phosphotransferase family protein [Actinomycetota bacterium]
MGAWLEANVDGARPPFDFELIAGGRSNLTFAVTDAAGARTGLRRPPRGQGLATAHDVGREHRIISALAGSAVPVPRALAWCDDPEVNGAPFFVMSFVDGVVVRDVDVGRVALDPEARHSASTSLVDVLAALHGLDPGAVGLGLLGRSEGYVARQLRRWYGQWEAAKTRELPDVDQVHTRLAASAPDQGPAAIVHGDYRIDNCVCHTVGPVAAVLDWELCTLGDPLADVGMLLICWTEEGEVDPARPDSPTVLPGFLGRAEVLERYAAASGRDLSRIDWYRAFAYWKLACISEGVYARYLGGAMGDTAGVDLTLLGAGAPRLAASARRALDEFEA